MPQLYQNQEQEVELTDREYLQALYNETMDNFDRMEEAGLYSVEEIDEHRANTIDEYHNELAAIEGFGVDEDEDEELEYGEADYDTANFSVGNRFGEALLELIDEEFEGSEEEGIATLCEACDIEPEQLAALVSGELVADENLVDAISSIFESTQDEDAYNGLQTLAAEARGEEISYEDEEIDDDDEDQDVDDEASYRIAELENQVASFSANESVKDAIANLELQARELVENGSLTPFEAETMFGNFELEANRTAAFSQMCGSKQVDIATEIYAMQYSLDLAAKRGPIASFGAAAISQNPIEVQEDVLITRQAKLNNNSRIDAVLNATLRP